MLVSVIIPCYNVEAYVEECVLSVISQSFKNIEIICVDNNSTDSTFFILENLKKKYSFLYLCKESKPGAPSARNRGLELAKGDYIQFLDADDLLKENKIAHQIDLIIKSAELNIGFVAAACIKRTVKNTDFVISDISSEIFLSPFINKCGNTCSNLWNKQSLLEVGMWNENIESSQEADMMLRLVLAGNLFLVDKEPLTIIREREIGQISHRDPEAKWRQFIEIRINYLEHLKNNNNAAYQSYKGIFYDFMMVSLFTLANYNKQEAVAIYVHSVKNNWVSAGSYGFNKLKVALIKTLGFSTFIKIDSKK